jgi:hypothetical protein
MDEDVAAHRYYREVHRRRRRRRRLLVIGFWVGAAVSELVGSVIYVLAPTGDHWSLLGLFASPILIAAIVTGAASSELHFRNPPGTDGGGYGPPP